MEIKMREKKLPGKIKWPKIKPERKPGRKKKNDKPDKKRKVKIK